MVMKSLLELINKWELYYNRYMKFSELVEGEYLSETQYYKVEKVAGNKVQLKPEGGASIIVDKAYAETFLNSSVQFSKTEGVNRTRAVEIFLGSTRVAMTVNFNKQLDLAKAKREIIASQNVSMQLFKKRVGELLTGEERTMTGKHFGAVDNNGRIVFTDANASGVRTVDPRTINWLIVGGVKYVVK